MRAVRAQIACSGRVSACGTAAQKWIGVDPLKFVHHVIAYIANFDCTLFSYLMLHTQGPRLDKRRSKIFWNILFRIQPRVSTGPDQGIIKGMHPGVGEPACGEAVY